MSFIGIEESTDMRYPDPTFKRLPTERAALKWLAGGLKGFAYPGAADPNLPMTQQNFHHRIRTAYEMPAGWRLSRKEVDDVWSRASSSIYRSTGAARIAVILRHTVRRLEAAAKGKD